MNSVHAKLAPLLSGPSLVADVMARLTKWTIEVSDCERVRLFRIDRARNELHCRMSNGTDVYELRVPVGRGLHGQVIQNQAPQSGRSPETGDELLVVPVFSPAAPHGADSEVIAVIEFANKRGGQPFEAVDEDNLTRIAVNVGRVLTHARLDDSRRAPERITEVVGSSAAMLALYSRIQQVAMTDAPVTLTGAHGTGKALIARAIHHLSPRRHRPLVSLRYHSEREFLEAELFGVSGSEAQLPGALRRAQGSTLLLEQLSLLSAASQAKLLETAATLGVRLIIANKNSSAANSNAPMQSAFAESFSAEAIAVPTLAERGPDDVTALARHFVREWAFRLQVPSLSIDDDALSRLRAQSWPGNVQELEKCIQSAVLSCTTGGIAADDLCLPGTKNGGATSDSIPSGLLLADAEERYILRTLTENHENRTRTASSLGIGRNTLVRKIKQYRNK